MPLVPVNDFGSGDISIKIFVFSHFFYIVNGCVCVLFFILARANNLKTEALPIFAPFVSSSMKKKIQQTFSMART